MPVFTMHADIWIPMMLAYISLVVNAVLWYLLYRRYKFRYELSDTMRKQAEARAVRYKQDFEKHDEALNALLKEHGYLQEPRSVQRTRRRKAANRVQD